MCVWCKRWVFFWLVTLHPGINNLNTFCSVCTLKKTFLHATSTNILTSVLIVINGVGGANYWPKLLRYSKGKAMKTEELFLVRASPLRSNQYCLKKSLYYASFVLVCWAQFLLDFCKWHFLLLNARDCRIKCEFAFGIFIASLYCNAGFFIALFVIVIVLWSLYSAVVMVCIVRRGAVWTELCCESDLCTGWKKQIFKFLFFFRKGCWKFGAVSQVQWHLEFTVVVWFRN